MAWYCSAMCWLSARRALRRHRPALRASTSSASCGYERAVFAPVWPCSRHRNSYYMSQHRDIIGHPARACSSRSAAAIVSHGMAGSTRALVPGEAHHAGDGGPADRRPRRGDGVTCCEKSNACIHRRRATPAFLCRPTAQSPGRRRFASEKFAGVAQARGARSRAPSRNAAKSGGSIIAAIAQKSPRPTAIM